MNIAIISDSHDNVPNIYKALNFIKKQKADMIIHCGDVCAGSVLDDMAKKFPKPIHFIYGNIVDTQAMEKITSQHKNLFSHKNLGKLEIEGKKIAFTHLPYDAKDLAAGGKFNYVFYGHNHKPWIEKIKNTYLINPGTLGGLFSKATFAWWDTSKVEPKLIILEKI